VGAYDERGKLLSSFRYMEDGTFTDVEENDVELDESAAIGLCHPLDLGAELSAEWSQQLSDYEIKQPIEQLSRKVFALAEGDRDMTAMKGFHGAKVYAGSLLGKLQKFGWRRGSVEDAGVYYSFYKEDKKQNIGVQLAIDGIYIGADPSEEVEVHGITFYKAGTVEYGSYVYDRIKKENLLTLSQVPPRLYSEILYDVERATANRIS